MSCSSNNSPEDEGLNDLKVSIDAEAVGSDAASELENGKDESATKSPKMAGTNDNSDKEGQTDMEADEEEEEGKGQAEPAQRARRSRNPVVLLQHDYYEMYAEKNNRAVDKRKRSNSSQSNSADGGGARDGNNNSNPNNSINPKRRKISGTVNNHNKSKKQALLKKASSSSGSSYKTKSTFRWIGSSIAPPTSSDPDHPQHISYLSKKNKYYQKLELNVGNHPAKVQVGDVVLITSSDYDENELHDNAQKIESSTVNTKSRSEIVNNMVGNEDDDNEEDADDSDKVLNSTLLSEEKMDIAMNSLDPYIGRIEEMWEEPKLKKEKDEVEYPFSRMKFRVRWFYKKADVLALRGKFVGVSRSKITSALIPRDIMLGEQSDVNEISTILGKCRVIRVKPQEEDYASAPTAVKGAFFCRYNIKIVPPSKSKGSGKIIVTPYDGPDEEDEDTEVVSKRVRSDSNVSHGISIQGSTFGSEIDAKITELDTSKSGDVDDDDDSSIDNVEKQDSKQAPITEGTGTLKIKVGSEHQATIPYQMNKRRYSVKREGSTLVWKPQAISDEKLNEYFRDASKILKDHMEKKGMNMTRSLPPNVPTGTSPAAYPFRSSSQCEYREFNVDDLLYLLHDHEYNTITALRGLKNYPEDYLYIWTNEDKELYNIGFQKYASNLHSIGQNLTETKDHKEVVDYHYRFKIPEQFKRFQDLKREQARRMLEVGERLRLNEYLSEDGQHSMNGTGNGMKKSQQQWSRNVGGPGEVGELESRRLECKTFLFEVREAVGVKNYLTVVNLLKSLNAKVLTIPQMKEGFGSILQKHPDLLNKFETYLPTMYRT